MTSVRSLQREWSTLSGPTLGDLEGTFEAGFVRPLTHLAPRGLGLVGLARWYGKRFTLEGDHLAGVNLVRPRTGTSLVETLPMTAALEASWADGRPCIAITYATDAARPWRWVRDEARPWTQGRCLALTFVDRPGLRRAPGTPFVLTRRADA